MDALTPSQNDPGQPLISRALLKAVCEPFFDQMLTAVHEAVEQQLMQNQQRQMQQQQMQQQQSIDPLGDGRCFRSSSMHFQQGACQLEPLPDEESLSTDLDEVGGAFASLLSGPSSEHESEDEGSDVVTNEMTLKSSSESHALDDEAGVADSEKSTMVCRHWKSKGWCRLEENCKFLHPECKKGVSAPKGGSKSSAVSGTISGVEGSCISATECPADQLPPVAVGGRRRRRNRATKEQPNNSLLHDISDVAPSGEHPCWNIPCTAFLSAGAQVQVNGCPFILYSAAPSS